MPHQPGWIDVEYLRTLDPDEQKLSYSHECRVKSGCCSSQRPLTAKTPTDATKQAICLYGKTWHSWEAATGHGLMRS